LLRPAPLSPDLGDALAYVSDDGLGLLHEPMVVLLDRDKPNVMELRL